MFGTNKEYNSTRKILMGLEKNALVDALMTLAGESRSAYMLVLSLVSTTTEKVALFKQNIHAITHEDHSGEEILDTLSRSLGMLDPEIMDPKVGLQLMVLFYGTDSWALESTTELDFEFEMVYTDDGFKKFAEFAQRCPDPEYVTQVVEQLLAADGYCMRTKLSTLL